LASQSLKSLIPATMTVSSFIDILNIQALLKGLPDRFDVSKINLRSQDDLSIEDVVTRILSEETAMTYDPSYSRKISQNDNSAMKVGKRKHCNNRGCPNPIGHLSAECWHAHPELKIPFQSKKTNRHRVKEVQSIDNKTKEVETTNLKIESHQAWV
jgi:hypothetical protein